MQRNKAIDVFSALFLFEIIIQHILQNSGLIEGSFFQNWIERLFPVYMPWFYFKSGMMFRGAIPVRDMIVRRSKKLLWPFAVWSFIPSVVMFFIIVPGMGATIWLREGLSMLALGQGAFNVPLWFLLSLFFCYIIIDWLELKKANRYVVWLVALGVSYLFCFLSPYFPAFGGRHCLPLGIHNLPLGVLFFETGIIYRYSKKTTNLKWLLLVILFYLVVMIVYPSSVSFINNTVVKGSYSLWVIMTVVFLFAIGNLTESKWTIKGLDYLGKNSMVLYVSHAVVIIALPRINSLLSTPLSNTQLGLLMSLGILCFSVLLLAGKGKTPILYSFK